MNPSGFQDTYIVMRNIAQERKQIVDAFPSGQLALNDAELRFQDTGDNYNIFKAIGDPDQAIIDASGFLQAQIPDVLNDLDDVVLTSPIDAEVLTFNGTNWVNAPVSGTAEETVVNIINDNIILIASGVFEQAFFTLPLKGDDDDVAHQTVNNLAVARYIKNTNTNTLWNTIAPLGGASGVEFQLSWFPEASQTSDLRWRLTLTQLPSGIDTSIATNIFFDLDLSDSWVANRLYINTINIDSTVGSLENFSLKFGRRGQDAFDSYSNNLYVVSYAVRFKT